MTPLNGRVSPVEPFSEVTVDVIPLGLRYSGSAVRGTRSRSDRGRGPGYQRPARRFRSLHRRGRATSRITRQQTASRMVPQRVRRTVCEGVSARIDAGHISASLRGVPGADVAFAEGQGVAACDRARSCPDGGKEGAAANRDGCEREEEARAEAEGLAAASRLRPGGCG
jgi:hypothetical protein